MLKKFGFENSYSFDGWVELDMTADLSEDLDAGNHYYPKMIELFDRVRMREHGDEVGVLPVAAFYGKNAGGKTNIIKALRDMA
ncbi:MAG: ATP-binding protein, partial [Defluviitaleaceae bacterium]|nr:ATP-binding protein [Defluviitaleaceae bacterium]